MEKSEDFQKIIDDFVKDLLISFPEYEDKLMSSTTKYYSHCKNFTKKFFKFCMKMKSCSKTKSCFCSEVNFRPFSLTRISATTPRRRSGNICS